MGSDAKQLVRGYIQTVWNEGRPDRLEEFVDPGFVDHESTFPFPVRGLEGLRRVVVFFRTAFPDIQCTIDDIFAEGPKVVIRYTTRGTHRGSLVGFAGTGRRVTVTGQMIVRTEGGRIMEAWSQWDTLGLLQQLGVQDPTDFQPISQPSTT